MRRRIAMEKEKYHLSQECEDLLYDIRLVRLAVEGLQTMADGSIVEPRHIDPITLFLGKIEDRATAMLAATDGMALIPVPVPHPRPPLSKSEAAAFRATFARVVGKKAAGAAGAAVSA
jgi:hypothetical protein